ETQIIDFLKINRVFSTRQSPAYTGHKKNHLKLVQVHQSCGLPSSRIPPGQLKVTPGTVRLF
ncbi:MAG: hypothetical protein ACPGSB_11245, partial [Opitutales bacterium]